MHQVELELQNEELRGARLDLEAAFRRYEELFDFAPVGYVHLGPDGAIRRLNFAAARLLGAPRGELDGRELAAFVAARDRPVFQRFLGDVLARSHDDAAAPPQELLVLGREAAPHVRVTAALLDGAEPTALLALEDVTSRRRAEEALRESARRKDEFLAALSHELRNPLAPIRNGLFLIERVPPGGEQARRALAVIERQVTHLTRLVDDLLDVTRIERGKVRLRRERVELSATVRRTADDHEQAFGASGIRLETELEGDVWVDADASRISQVLGNLLGNALKFTNRGGRVTVLLAREAGWAVLRVRDTGVGLAPEVRERLFEPFSQAPQTIDRTQGGLGLGLATVKGLVELHGGTVEVASDGPGRGAEFRVRLPLSAPPPAPRAEAPPPRAGPRRVLVIDDNEDAASTLEDLLELNGHDVRTAGDGPRGIELAHGFRPEVVVCDIGLPGIDGYEVARRLRRDPDLRDVWLVAMSGYAAPEDLQRARDAGFDRHVAKPPTTEALETLFTEAPLPGGGDDDAPRR